MKIKKILLSKSFIFFISSISLVFSVMGAIWMIKNKPVAQKRERILLPPIVNVIEIQIGNYPVVISAMGKVIPSRQVIIKARIPGEILKVSEKFMAGGIFKKGEFIAKIDDRDYILSEKKALALVEKARSAVELENAQQTTAKKQYFEFLSAGGATENENFILRKPQENSVVAELKSAEVALEQARLDIERTIINAPFNGILISTAVQIGAQVSAQTEIATIVDSDIFWIQSSIPQSDLEFIIFPNAEGKGGSTVKIAGYQENHSCAVIKILADLDEDEQMVKILIEAKDPIPINSNVPNVFINQLLNIKIIGKEVENCFRIPKNAIRDGKIYLLTKDSKLRTIVAQVIWSDREWSFIKNEIPKEDKLIVSDLPFIVEGMQLRSVGYGASQIIPEDQNQQKSE